MTSFSVLSTTAVHRSWTLPAFGSVAFGNRTGNSRMWVYTDRGKS